MASKGNGKTENIVYLNGRVYTVDKNGNPDWFKQPQSAIVIEDGIIRFLGSNVDAETYITCDTEVIDLEDATVLPGIHDVHVHPLEAGSPVAGTCKLPKDTSPEKMIELIKRSYHKQKGTTWILGHGYSLHSILRHIEKGGRPPKMILDEAIPDRPAVMMEETSHSVWVNSNALEIAGINKDTENIPAGIIMKDPKTGEPNGILFENAGNFIMELAMAPTKELEELNYEGLLTGLKELSKNGITSVCDARVFWKSGHHVAWERALKENRLTARAILGLWVYPHLDDNEQIQTLKSMYNNYPESMLRISQIKMYADGLLDSTTAAVIDPYRINYHLEGLSDNRGMNYFHEVRIGRYIKELQNFDHGKGFDFHIHTIGDRGVHESINAIESCLSEQDPKMPSRHRLTHLELVHLSDIHRFFSLGVVADFQVSGEFTLPKFRKYNAELIGKSKAKDAVPVKSLVDSGAHVTLSSDWDVSDLNPFLGIQHATQREHQSVDVKTAVEMYTINGAYIMRQEDKVGSLVAGKEADLIVIDQNIFEIAPKDIGRTKVLQTMLKGKEVYRSPKF